MTLEKIEAAITETIRFLVKAKSAQRRFKEDKYAADRSIQTSAMKRASMDLSRTLSDLRKP